MRLIKSMGVFVVTLVMVLGITLSAYAATSPSGSDAKKSADTKQAAATTSSTTTSPKTGTDSNWYMFAIAGGVLAGVSVVVSRKKTA